LRLFAYIKTNPGSGKTMALPRILLKNEVHLNGAHLLPEMVAIITALRATAPPTTDNAVWITSANDGTHMKGSLHYKNRAFDVRILNLTNADTATSWVEDMKLVLGIEYDVVLEHNHIHVEFDPKET